MKFKTLLFAFMATVLAAATPQAHSQDLGARMVSWFTGDCAVLDNACCDSGPKCYAEDTCCPDGTCGQCSACCHCLDTWGSVEFLMWWARGTSLPPLVTTSLPGTAQVQAGVLGQPNTSILFGDQLATSKLQGGGRVTAGIWLDPDHNVAAGGRFFGLGGDTTRFAANSSTGDPILGLPFFNSLLNQEDAFLVAYPGLSRGSIQAHATTNNILGAEAFTEIMMVRDTYRRIDLVAGYQFFRLNDWLQINSNSTLTAPGPLQGLHTELNDRFSTRNEFHGGELGLRGRLARGQWSLNVLGQVAIGNINQQVTIAGTTVTTGPGGGAGITTPGGLLAQPTNIGEFERNKFSYIPQVIANVHYHLTPNVSVHLGYNIMWLGDIALSGDQIDQRVNPSQFAGGPLVGDPTPAFAFQDREYWLQGINWGVNWDF